MVPGHRWSSNTFAAGPSNAYGSVNTDAEQTSLHATYTPGGQRVSRCVVPRPELAWRRRSQHGARAAHRARLGNGFGHPMRREVHGVLIRAPGRLRRPSRTRVGDGAVS
jgi:hypothetical protein